MSEKLQNALQTLKDHAQATDGTEKMVAQACILVVEEHLENQGRFVKAVERIADLLEKQTKILIAVHGVNNDEVKE